ncbi:aminotransferase class V-fold PLP-dependent enzyme [Iningainema tapete]|uniref:Aminotransferase class V-fold PLP-dependent enzyme n=1 Tax=Iningainema tapete BLCC-T55 TaxID=2748662 RepID=A0A8J7C0U5_9CYAN|nr:aminotransferase class V-fold PLP-dependent enzyme [Iningainema tapete]MBD2778698.1 aminotransferase class V-fold PLP-dependent enzyme [Iningainema tapete BLCC-T55]
MLHHHREKFPALTNKTYFNYGGQGPMPLAAMEAINQAQAYIQQIGPFGTAVNNWIREQVQDLRVAIAALLNVSKETITITEDVTVGCNIAMWGIDWKSGDRLLLSDCEHPGIMAIALEIARRFGVEVTTIPLMATLNEGDPTEIIAQYLRPNTRLVVLSHILWNTGQVLPLDKIATICIQNQTKLLIDAAQSVGLLPLNLTTLGVDFYAFTGHKWLCGPGGVGGLYVKPEARESLKPTFIGWRGVISDSTGKPVDWYPDGKRYEVATSNYPLYCGLKTAISTHEEWGTAEERFQQICHTSQYLWQRLSELSSIRCLKTSPPESGLVSFEITNQEKTSSQLVAHLESLGLLTRTIAYPDCVRTCVHYFTLQSEIDHLVETIERFC